MGWSNQTMQMLGKWLAPGTWYKKHPLDDSRFCVFVASVWNDEHKLWDESAARDIIANEAKNLHEASDELAKEVAERRVSEGTTILDFLTHVRDEKRFDLVSC